MKGFVLAVLVLFLVTQQVSFWTDIGPFALGLLWTSALAKTDPPSLARNGPGIFRDLSEPA
jgi:hypothetical protein